MYGGGGTSVPGAGAKGGRAWHTGMGIMVFWMTMWITGAALLPIGISQQSAASQYSPEVDFTTVSGGCKVLTVAHVADQRQDKNPFCVDVYTYTLLHNERQFNCPHIRGR
jgi:hypothetical protein